MPTVQIRPATGPAEHPALVAIWRGAVDATHHFLAAADRDEIEARLASDYLPAVLLSVAEVDGLPAGFSGVLDGTLEMLFVDAARRGSGIGSALLAHAIAEHGVTAVDVNEQNVEAAGFYARRGFEVVGRSETDEAGRPYPVLHLRLPNTSDTDLTEFFAECMRRGYISGLDFFIQGFDTTPSSELIMLVRQADAFRVLYSDMGRRRTLAEGSLDEVRPVFFQELAILAYGRGRGPAPVREPRQAGGEEGRPVAITDDAVWDQFS